MSEAMLLACRLSRMPATRAAPPTDAVMIPAVRSPAPGFDDVEFGAGCAISGVGCDWFADAVGAIAGAGVDAAGDEVLLPSCSMCLLQSAMCFSAAALSSGVRPAVDASAVRTNSSNLATASS